MFPAYLRDVGYYTTNNSKKDYNVDETPGTWDESSGTASWRDRPEGAPFFHMQSFGRTHESSLHFSEAVYRDETTETDPASVFVAPYHPDTDLFRYTVARYHDKITTVDEEIGAVVDQLEKDGLLEDTFILYFGDHGGVLPRGKGYAYESGLHVPLVVRVPDNFRHLSPWSTGSTVAGFTEFIDYSATTLNLAGVPIPEGIDGRPFLGPHVNAAEVNARDTALGYADRFDEKYDLVRTLRKGKYEYIRNYQPFNFDGLQNNYRYIMLAYREWRDLYHAGKLNAAQRQFFETRPVEMLFDISADPHEVVNLAADPGHASVLAELRAELSSRLKSLPDLSFYPESTLAKEAFADPTGFGDAHRREIVRLIDIADLSLLGFSEAEAGIRRALASSDATERYWGLIVCSCFANEATGLGAVAQQLADNDEDLLVRTRAAEFLAIAGLAQPAATLLDCLRKAESGIESNLILNTVVLLRDGATKAEISVNESDLHPNALEFQDVRRRLAYLSAPNGIPDNPQGKPSPTPSRKRKPARP